MGRLLVVGILVLLVGVTAAVILPDPSTLGGDSTAELDPLEGDGAEVREVGGSMDPMAYVIVEEARNASLSFTFEVSDQTEFSGVWFLQDAKEAPGILGLGNAFNNPVAQGSIFDQRVDPRLMDTRNTESMLGFSSLTVKNASDRFAVGMATDEDATGTITVEWDGDLNLTFHTDPREPVLLETSELEAGVAFTGRFGPTYVPEARANLNLPGVWLGQAWIVLPSGSLKYCVDAEPCWTQPGAVVACRSPALSGSAEIKLSMSSEEGSLFAFAAVPQIFEDATPESGLVCDRTQPPP